MRMLVSGDATGRDASPSVHAFRPADQMRPMRRSQFIGHLLVNEPTIIDEAQGGPGGADPTRPVPSVACG